VGKKGLLFSIWQGQSDITFREGSAPYKDVFGAENGDIGLEDTHFWDGNNE
jgi:hypothetical protein